MIDNPQRILVIQLKRAGDVLCTTPIPTVLKQRWPQAQVDFLVDKPFASLLENHPSINSVRIYDRNRMLHTLSQIRAQKYDYVFDFQCSPRSAIAVGMSGARLTAGYRVTFWGRTYTKTIRRPDDRITVVQGKLSLLESILGSLKEEPTLLALTVEEQRWADTLRKTLTQDTVVGMVPTHRKVSRRWPAASFGELARKIDAAGWGCWIFWGPGEEGYAKEVQALAPRAKLIPAASLRQMAALLSRCDLVVTNDNGPMHLAVAVGSSTVTIYGPTVPEAWNPGGPHHRALQAPGVTCLGCNLNSCPFNHECMRDLSVERVFATCEQALNEEKRLCSVK